MNASVIRTSVPPFFDRHRIKHIPTIVLILLLHILCIWFLAKGLGQQTKTVVAVSPKEVFVTLIAPEPAPPVVAPPTPKKPERVVEKRVEKPIEKPVEKPVHHHPVPLADKGPKPAPAAPTPPPAAATPEPAASPTPPSPPAQPATPPTISTGVEYVQPPQPEYPPMSRRMHEEGKTVLRVLIDDHGRAKRIEISKSSGSPRLDEAARQAMSRAVFKPHTENGKAVEAYVIAPITFDLNN